MSSLIELGWPNYEFQEIRNIKEIREIFPNGVADKNNWIFLSQKCFHGTDETLDEIERILLGQGKARPLDGKYWTVTVLILCPRLTTVKWGYVDITINDIEFLRGLVRSTLEVVRESQEGNV